MREFKLTGWMCLGVFLCMTLIIQVSAYAGEYNPGATFYIAKKPGNKSIAIVKTDRNGKFRITRNLVLKKGKYVVYIKLGEENKAFTKAKEYEKHQLSKASTKAKKYQVYIQIGKFDKSRKVDVFKKRILIPKDKLSGDKKFKAFTFELNEDITIGPVPVPRAVTASGSKGGFAIGGFSPA